jgi:hypothetical protein
MFYRPSMSDATLRSISSFFIQSKKLLSRLGDRMCAGDASDIFVLTMTTPAVPQAPAEEQSRSG